MARPVRQGFTLVEMLVVMTIIGMLVGLLIPAALGVQNAARRSVCVNNMREITLACLRYEGKSGRFPPQFYYETWPRTGVNNSQQYQKNGWVVMILEELGKGELAGLFRDKKLILPPVQSLAYGNKTPDDIVMQARLTMGHSYISQLVCPANPPSSLTLSWLSYVCNAGMQDADTAFSNSAVAPDHRENGVFMNYHVNYAPPTEVLQLPNEKVSNAFINDHDGTSQTLLLSENVNAQIWAQDVTLGPLTSGFDLSPTQYQQGMLWSPTSLVIAGLGNFRVADPGEEIFTVPPDQVGIHQPELLVSRPSSLHGNGYHAAFCSGNVMWLSTQMDKSIYPLLMTPWGQHATVNNGNTPSIVGQNRGDGTPMIINEVELSK